MGNLLVCSAAQASRLTGLTQRQLSYWDRTGFFSPDRLDDQRRGPFNRVYSFRDIVGLRTIALLRKKYNIPLQELRKVGAWFKRHYKTPWASLTFYVAGRRVFFEDPQTGARTAVRPMGQQVFPIEMVAIERDVQREANRLRERQPAEVGEVKRNRYVAHNAPVVSGTRISTAAIWNLHEAGYDTATIIAEFPQLTPKDVRAAISYEQKYQRRLAS